MNSQQIILVIMILVVYLILVIFLADFLFHLISTIIHQAKIITKRGKNDN